MGAGVGTVLQLTRPRDTKAEARCTNSPAESRSSPEPGPAWQSPRAECRGERRTSCALDIDVVAHYGVGHQVYNSAGITHNGDVEISDFKDIGFI